MLDPDPGLGALALSNRGRSFYREFQLTGRYKIPRGTINASYVRSKAFGNLNDFNQFFGNNAAPVIERTSAAACRLMRQTGSWPGENGTPPSS